MLEPKAERIELTSPPSSERSLPRSLFLLYVFVGSHTDGEGVIIGCCCSCKVAAALVGAGEVDTMGKRNVISHRRLIMLGVRRECRYEESSLLNQY